jgi:hypothetical protein
MNDRRLQEAAIVLLLFVSAACWGTFYWNRSLQAGRQPSFYQLYYEPAVMMACGHGFVQADPPLAAITEFVLLKRDTLSCADIPPGTQLTARGLDQKKAWIYLLATVAAAWRMLGISWSGLGPLLGVLFGATIVAAYGIFRVGMGRAIAAACAVALMVSSVHLQNLPHLRDYAKAPFTLTLMLLLFLLVAGAATWRRLLTIAAAYGVVLGIGYGFRTDFLIDIPLFLLVLVLFIDGGVLRNLALKGAAAAVFALAFAASAWPVIRTVQRSGGCQWHAVLLGLTDGPSDALMVTRAPYDFGHDFSDDFVYAQATAFALRTGPNAGHIEYCSPEYDVVTGRYVRDIARTFPGDMVTRGVASTVQVLQLPFRWYDQPLPGFANLLYRVRLLLLKPLRGTGPVLMTATVLALAAVSIRLGLFALFFLFYAGGYPMLQFDVRHYFHLEFMTWWSIGFLVQQLAVHRRAAGGRWRTMIEQIRERYAWRRAVAVLGGAAACLLVAMWVARGYQQRQTTRLFQKYIDAPREAVRVGQTSGAMQAVAVPLRQRADADPMPAGMIEIDLDRAHCGENTAVMTRYRAPNDEFGHRVAAGGEAHGGMTRIFEPVFGGFEGVVLEHAAPHCVAGIYRMTSPERIPLLLSVRLEDGWERRPLYQRLNPWRWSIR